ncbi:ABC transporter ATP-binding protein [Oceanobacillus sp. CAU 1775]
MANKIIEVKQLTKQFKENRAVYKADITITKGEIFGLIGRNGAGKSTLLKMIGGLVHPTSGEIRLFDDAVKGNHAYFERMGLLIESPGFFPAYTAYKNLDLIAISYGIKDRKKHINEMLERVGLDSKNHSKVKDYSMGMKQRLGIAAALMGSPDVLILDEPINGLDPQGISEIRELILDLNKMGITILISSHILEELSKVATRYAIINNGEILEVISKEELLIQCEERIELEVDEAKLVTPILERELGILNYKVLNDQFIHIYDKHVESKEIINMLVEKKLAVHSIQKNKQSLEQYFLKRTGKAGDPLVKSS